MLSQEQGASGPQDRDMMGETKTEKIGIHAPIGFAIVCALQIAFELILEIDRRCRNMQ